MPALPGSDDPLFSPELLRLGFNDRWAAVLADLPGQVRPLRVIRDDRGAVVAAGADGETRLPKPPGLHPITGDWIAVEDERIVAVLERSSAVVRPRPDGAPQVLAANVDLVGTVHGLDQPLNRRRLERGLILAWESGAEPLVVLTKADVAGDLPAAVSEAAASGPGVDVVVVSTVDGRGIDDLRERLVPNKTLALIGASGVGKSTLVNALVGDDVMATNAVRAVDGKGRHTTTHRELFVVPTGGVLLDTPGLRALTIGVASEGIDKTFPEIEALAYGCRFGDCRHEQEPGCAVLAAAADGTLPADRLEGWRRVQREVASAQLRADPIALRERGRQWGRMAREAMDLKHGPGRGKS